MQCGRRLQSRSARRRGGKARVTDRDFAPGCTLALGGGSAQRSASQTILVLGAFVIAVMVMLVSSALGSMRAALLVMVNLPLSLIGGILAIYITGRQPCSGTRLPSWPWWHRYVAP